MEGGKQRRSTFLAVDVPGPKPKEWNRLPPDIALKLVDSMKRRVAALIDSNGDYTIY